MAIFRRLIQNPSSPEKALKALTGSAKYKGATFARLADVNELSRSENDQAAYTLALGAGITGTQAITTKRGIIKITASGTASSLTITLTNSEFLVADVEKYFVQVTAAHPTINTVTTVIPIAADGSMAVKITQLTGAGTWNTLYLNYEIVKIGD